MSLTGRFSALVLGTVGLILLGFSFTLYMAASIYLHRQMGERLTSALAILAAAAEIHPDSVEWEPQERALPLGQEAGEERLRWMVFDDRGHRIDHSRNLNDSELTPAWTPKTGGRNLPSRLRDRQGRSWRVAQRVILPNTPRATGSEGASHLDGSKPPDPAEAVYPSLVLTACAPMEPIRATLSTLLALLTALSLGIWSATALVCRRLSKRALRPLAQLADSARSLDATEPGWRLDEARTGDELEELGESFNSLLSRLHVAYEQQRRFSSHASHQLRTPLTVLIGQLEVALRHDRSGEEYRRALRSALGRAMQLGQIVEALLFLARSEAESELPGRETLDLNTWLGDHLASRSAGATHSNIELHLQTNGPAWVHVHPVLLGQLLDNLIDNAEKYGVSAAPIRVRVSRENSMVILGVEDEGHGIAPSDLPRVFEPFYRASSARRPTSQGVGLGLAIVHRIATVLGGRVEVQSELGRGCRFECHLPAANPDEAKLGTESDPFEAPELPEGARR
ncbi:sensor histidine kinase [Singulisphaera sp. PoT]|uniref:sensor histidine kinase n=1 Tax=Singulisphaera sp. PoT TaxID=3411797 RepID=UPI003BF4E29D